MDRKIGIHTGSGWFQHLDIIERWQPPVMLVLSPNKEEIQQLRKIAPNTIIVGRIYIDDSDANNRLKTDPVAFAKFTDEKIREANIPEIDYWVLDNEPTPYWDWLPNINTYNLELMKLGDKNGYKVGILSLSVGNFDLPQDNTLAYWRPIKESLDYCQANGHVVLVHQYQKPNLINNDESDDWYIFRLERKVLPLLGELGLSNIKFIISEIGVDHLINGGNVGGFQKTPLDDRTYYNQLMEWESIEQDYPNVIGGCIFMFGSQSPWESYSITDGSNVANMIADYYASLGNGDKPDMAKKETYIPSVKNEKDSTIDSQVEWDDRLTQRGVVLTPVSTDNLKDGYLYWKVVKGEYLEEKEHIFVNVLATDGQPFSEDSDPIQVMFYWADDNVVKDTKDISNDKYAYGMADFDMHAHGRAYGVKIKSNAPSDDVFGMGLGSVEQPDWNIHVSYRLTFQLTKYKAEEEPAPEESKKKTTKRKKKTETQVPQDGGPAPTLEDDTDVFKPFKGRVMATVLNVRSTPEMGDNVVTQLGNGATVQVTERTEDGWYKIGENQYVADQWIEKYSEDHEIIDSLLNNFTRLFALDRKVVQAIVNVESGNAPFGVNGKPIIRFENHIFFQKLNKPDVYYKYFWHTAGQPTQDHRWREDENAEWVTFHGNQKLEWKVFEFAKTLDERAAEESISMGMPQVMGFNHDKLGYITAGRMLEEFSQQNITGIVAQVFAFFVYCYNTPGMIKAIQDKNWEYMGELYNGSRLAGEIYENAYKKLV